MLTKIPIRSLSVKKNYYNLAKLCHPDRGGNSEDMNVVYKCYKCLLSMV